MHASSPLLPFVHRLERHSRIGPQSRATLLELPCTVTTIERGGYLVRQGQHPKESRVVLKGLLFRQKLTATGGRAIVSIHLPGQVVDLHNSFLTVADHTVQALTHAEVALLPRRALASAAEKDVEISRALLVETLIDSSVLMEWQANIARRSADSRLAHLLCELGVRLAAADLGDTAQYRIPMTQEQLADCLGITGVHVNRILRAFDRSGVIERKGRDLLIARPERLAGLADFDPTYLHLQRAEARLPE